MEDQYLVKPVYKALELLKVVGQAGTSLSLGDVCAATGLPRSTAFKYLRTLRECGFIAHESSTDQYRVGLLVWQLGQLSGSQNQIRQTVLPYMRELRERFDETVNFGILDGTDVVYVETVHSRRTLRSQTTVGSRDFAYATALGKALLAHLPRDEWRSHLPTKLEPRTSRTITTVAGVAKEMLTIRARGYATDRGENEEGEHCVAVPILGNGALVTGALSIAAPTVRSSRTRERDVVAALLAASEEASTLLGHAS